jgi:MFS transporter, DHA2 family, multidrug resistance protein
MAVVVAVSSAGSPTVAAAILSVASWRWLFLVNVPLGIVAFVLAIRTLPATPKARRSLDPPSVLLNALTFGLLVIGVDSISQKGGLAGSAALLAAAAAVAFVFVRRQLRQSAPLLPVDLLRLPVFALSLATSIASFASAALGLIALPFFFVDVLKLTAAQTGLLMTPWPVGTALIAPIAGRLADRLIPGLLSSAGLLVLGIGLALTALNLGHGDAWSFAWRLAICGLGFGFFQSPNNRLIIGSAPPHRSGGAAGLQSSGRLIGQSLGTAFMAIAFGRWPEHAAAIALWTAAGLAFAGACASGLRRGGGKAQAAG